MDGLRDFDDPQVMSLDALRALGRDYDAAHPGEWERRVALRKSSDLAVLIYTSGTTGSPKGAMLSHANLLAADAALYRRVRSSTRTTSACVSCRSATWRSASSASTRRSSPARGSTSWKIPRPCRRTCARSRPTVFGAVPRIWEKFYSVVLIRVKEATRLAQLAYRLAIGIGYKVAALREEGKPVPPHLAAAFWLARVLVLDNIRKAIGVHRARLLITGAAPISPDLLRWYAALGLEMVEVWGQTESGGISTSNPIGRAKPGSIGTRAAADGS